MEKEDCYTENHGEFVSGNIFIRPMHLEKTGDVVHGHKHIFDHTTIIFKGSVHVKLTNLDGTTQEKDFAAPAYLLVRKDVEHEITALEDNTIAWCVYSHRNAQGEVVQRYDGWSNSYDTVD